MHPTRHAAGALALLAMLPLAACGGTPDDGGTTVTDRATGAAAQKNGSGERRTDIEPLTSRFSALGTPESAIWMSGTYGDPDVPGPSTYWIDAVVQLAPATARELRRDYAPQPTDETPDVVDGIGADLPDGPLLTSDRLDAAFTEGRFSAVAYLAPDSDSVVLVALGE